MSKDNCNTTFLRGIGNMRRLSLKLSSKRYLALVSLAGGGEGAINPGKWPLDQVHWTYSIPYDYDLIKHQAKRVVKLMDWYQCVSKGIYTHQVNFLGPRLFCSYWKSCWAWNLEFKLLPQLFMPFFAEEPICITMSAQGRWWRWRLMIIVSIVVMCCL